MKDFLVISALIVILFFFPLQYVLAQENHNKMSVSEEIVHAYAQEARMYGRFTPEMIDKMRDELAKRLGIQADRIHISATMVPKYRPVTFDERELIEYEVHIPLRRIIAYNWGVTESQNKMTYVIKDAVVSEVLQP